MYFPNAVVDGFKSACGRVLRGRLTGGGTDPRPILWLLADHILLLSPSPAYLTISLVERSTGGILRQFSSLSPQDRAFWNLPSLSDEEPRSDIAAETQFETATVALRLRRIPSDSSQEILSSAAAEGAQHLLEEAGSRVLTALQSLPSDHPDERTARPAPVIAENLWHRHVDLIRTRLDPILTSYGRCELFPQDSHGLTRLFVVPRQPFTDRFWRGQSALRSVQRSSQLRPAEYGYTAGIFLTPTQQAERELTEHELEALGPLPNGARAIADTPLTSGIIDIGHPGERAVHNPYSREHYPGTMEANVKALEDRIYGPEWRSESIFYVPVHIGGVPWLALFSFHREQPTPAAPASCDLMWRRYHIYRDIVPTIAEEMAQAVAQAFADALSEAARDHLAIVSDPGLFAERVTSAWKVLSVAFPYGEARLSPKTIGNSVPLCLRLPGRSYTFFLSVAGEEPNVSYRLLDLAARGGSRLLSCFQAAAGRSE